MSRDVEASRPWALEDMSAPKPRIAGLAKSMRHAPTDAERKLWRALRQIELQGSHFRRQVVVEGFIADFACHQSKLIIEVDGGQHCESAADAARTEVLAGAGWRVLRFWNSDVLQNIGGVVEAIEAALDVERGVSSGATPTPAPSPQGGGGSQEATP